MEQIRDVQIDVTQMSFALQHDNEFFITFFLANRVAEWVPVPEFHLEVLELMKRQNIPRFCCAIPRDHAKTTLAKLTAVWHYLFSSTRFVVYVSNTHTIAAQACIDIISYLKSENFLAYHQAICGTNPVWEIEQEHFGLFKFVLFPGTEREKVCILKAQGAGQQVRGLNIDNQRPQLCIIDDLESEEQLSSEDESNFLKMKRWVYGTLMKALDKFGNRIIQLGNLLAYKCLIAEHTESKFWESVRYGCILETGEPLWPGVWTIPKLQTDFEFYKQAGMIDTWFAEMMNMPLGIGRGLIRAEDIYYQPRPLPEELEFGFITVDPAISKEKHGHRTCVVVHGYVEPCWRSVESFSERGVDPLMLFDKIIEFCYKWRINVVGIEANAYQAALMPVFRHFCLEKNIEGIEFVPLHSSARKSERLKAWCAELKSKNYALGDDDLLSTQQLLMFDPKRKTNDDDLIDAHAFAPQMMAMYMDLIINTYAGGGMPTEAQGVLQVAGF